jgi:hypothetical protein
MTAPELFCPLISVSSDGIWAGREGDCGELNSGFVSGTVVGTGLVCGTGCGTDGSGVTGFCANAPATARSIVNIHARYFMVHSGLVNKSYQYSALACTKSVPEAGQLIPLSNIIFLRDHSTYQRSLLNT